ncbi:hypothetical protein AB0M32_25675 [Streptomyces sp. NPDC051985]|uniref:Acg family FMN-binding oxidoreductase n=1 Tax=Streptomyces sp. NPDC051985 TaxID=3155807 RepID=UPI003426002B
MTVLRASTGPASYYLVRAAVTAPSLYNSQPWNFVAHDGELEVHADTSRRLPVADPDGRELVIGCGAALFNVRVAMRHLGFRPRVDTFPDIARPRHLATVRWGPYLRPGRDEEQMYTALLLRRTHHGPFVLRPLPALLVEELQQQARREGAELRILHDVDDLLRVAELIHTAEAVRRARPAHSIELANWTPPAGSARRDGLPARAYPTNPDTAAFAGRDYAAHARLGYPDAAAPHTAHETLGLAAVLTTGQDRPDDWLRAGQALERVLLHAAAHRVCAALHTQPLELPELRRQLRHTITAGRQPQVILRLGYAPPGRPTPRRPVRQVLSPAPRAGADGRGHGAREHLPV